MENARQPAVHPSAVETEIKSIKPKFDGAAGLLDLLIKELKSIYYIEKLLLKAFPKMIKNSCTFELIEAITIHQDATKKQIIRIEDAFVTLKQDPLLQRCIAIESLIQEIDDIVETTKFGIVRDAGIILALNKIEHYEIGSYTILATYAENLKETAIMELLAESLNEEKVAELRLAKIAQSIQFYDEKTLP